jgi:hypothetical protein
LKRKTNLEEQEQEEERLLHTLHVCILGTERVDAPRHKHPECQHALCRRHLAANYPWIMEPFHNTNSLGNPFFSFISKRKD